jgi:hypothetical protein
VEASRCVSEKTPGGLHGRVLFHHDNAPAHTSKVSKAALQEFRWELLPHPPPTFVLVPKLKDHIKGVRWESVNDVKTAVRQWLKYQPMEFYRDGLQRLETRYGKVS